ncbi:MAG: DEAD/DEAH box helicase, partial [Bacilli bacterium]
MEISNEFFSEIKLNQKSSIFGLTNYMKAVYICECFKKINSNILVVVDENSDINKMYNNLFTLTNKILTFPMDSIALSECKAISPEFMQERIDTLSKLSNGDNYIVITSLEGYLHKLISAVDYKDNTISLSVGTKISYKKLEEFLTANNYKRVDLVSMSGEFSFRGHILDIYLDNLENPVRIEFWDDEIDSIRFFDLLSQRSIQEINSTIIYPNADCLDDKMPSSTILDYVKGYNIIVDYSVIKNRYNTLYPNNTMSTDVFDCFIVGLDSNINLNIKKIYYNTEMIDEFNNDFTKLNKYLAYKIKNGYFVIISLDFENQVDVLINNLDLEYKVIKKMNEVDTSKVNVITSHFNESVDFVDKKICVLNSYTIFNKVVINKRYVNKFRFSHKIKSQDELVIGDFVVHEKHGIGTYKGIKTIDNKTIDGIVRNDFFEIIYKKGDKLFVPIEHIKLLQKYCSDSSIKPKINTLGGIEWEKTKRIVRGRMEEMAQKLLEIYSKRNESQGFACKSETVEELVFDNEFQFNLTVDQKKAIFDVKNDMEKAIPMDRLLCGDVGFGKTEVAFRACFKAMINNKQAAYLCPTTILSIQQYESALKRFNNVPINIALLNRFSTDKEKKEIYLKLKSGQIDFIIGTHSLLNSNIQFKDLGLLVVDEEHKFGVLHKEKIKEMKINVDVLTLTATPIPRTLQMSLIGIRGLSLIETPPVNRFPIQTYVLEYSDKILYEAIKKEISRDGQVYILCNVISSQNKFKKIIEKNICNAKVRVVNSKMKKSAIEKVFTDFNNHEFNVLIATTIIEIGIDVARANTLIVLDADKLGLSQLYQIRGRVGRSDNIAYAYLTYNSNKILTDDAKARLESIKTFTSLGSGFKLASRDLSIRGAGDILGHEQTGFIDTVGFDLYMKMLKDIVNSKDESDDVSISNPPVTNYSNHIPSEYVEADNLKIS